MSLTICLGRHDVERRVGFRMLRGDGRLAWAMLL